MKDEPLTEKSRERQQEAILLPAASCIVVMTNCSVPKDDQWNKLLITLWHNTD
jgi:hypothetical protein